MVQWNSVNWNSRSSRTLIIFVGVCVVASVIALVIGHARRSAPDKNAAQDSQAADAQGPASQPGDFTPNQEWPRQISSGDTTMQLYEPRIDKWGSGQIQGRAALAVETGDTDQKAYGMAYLTAKAQVDDRTHKVTLSDFRVDKVSFPTAPDKSQTYQSILAQWQGASVETIPVDTLENDIRTSEALDKSASYQLKNDPPRIIFSQRPAVLISIDGSPVMRSVPDSDLQRVVNTRALLLFDPTNNVYYLSLMDGWMSASSLQGQWSFVPAPSRVLNQIMRQIEANNRAGRSADGGATTEQTGRVGRTGSARLSRAAFRYSGRRESLRTRERDGTLPDVYVSTVPAELLTTDGAPQFQAIEGTSLLYATNTQDRIFLNTGAGDYYVLISGRWFRAKSLDGPWLYVAANTLPGDFSKIPQDSPAADVLSSVPGTPASQEAAICDQVPQTATVSRASARLAVDYDGQPEFRPIEGTSLQYAVNTATPVVEVSPASYYACQNGVWFDATVATGPWLVADYVPAEIYAIPPSCPVHYVTYASIYGFTPDVVYCGYTPGYYGTVIAPDGLVVYGTGWYWPPFVGTYIVDWPATYGIGVGFGWSPFAGWSLGFGVGYWGVGFAEPFWYPWWGPFGWGWGWQPAVFAPFWSFGWTPVGLWGPAFGFGWGWGGFGFGGGFDFDDRVGGFTAFNAFGQWGGAATVQSQAGWSNLHTAIARTGTARATSVANTAMSARAGGRLARAGAAGNGSAAMTRAGGSNRGQPANAGRTNAAGQRASARANGAQTQGARGAMGSARQGARGNIGANSRSNRGPAIARGGFGQRGAAASGGFNRRSFSAGRGQSPRAFGGSPRQRAAGGGRASRSLGGGPAMRGFGGGRASAPRAFGGGSAMRGSGGGRASGPSSRVFAGSGRGGGGFGGGASRMGGFGGGRPSAGGGGGGRAASAGRGGGGRTRR